MKFIVRPFFVFIFITGICPEAVLAQVGWTKAYDNAAVVTAEKHASEIGKRILEEGGNAVDAAVAVQFILAVTLPRAGNIGGGGFMILHLSDGTTTSLDFREKAPEAATHDMFLRNGVYQPDLSRRSILASGVPGVVDGMIKAIERYGRLPLEAVITPAIELARKGYRLSWSQARDLNENAASFKKYDGSRTYLTKPDGEPYEEGDLFVQKDLANTLSRIARLGREGFYSGKTAELIVEEMKRHNGLITFRDLGNYESRWREPVSMTFRGYELHLMPPPSSGGIAIAQVLSMLDNYNLQDLGYNSAEYIHLVTESMRRAFADRAHFPGDPEYIDIPLKELISKDYNNKRMQNFSWESALKQQEN